METRNKKQVKVQGKFRASKSLRLVDLGRGKLVPWLTVSGIWLEKLVFNVWDKVDITTSNNKIVIELAETSVSLRKKEV